MRFDKACDKRRYNLPSAGVDEVAVILPGDGDQESYQRDIVLFFRGGGLRLINEMSPMYHSLHFVLLFPTGQLGWHPKLIFGDFEESEVDQGEDEEQQEGAEQILAPGEESNDQGI